MASLPTPGELNWNVDLDAFLLTAHNADGTLDTPAVLEGSGLVLESNATGGAVAGLTDYAPQRVDLNFGTSATPITGVGPSMRLVRQENMTIDAAGVTGPKNQADNEGNAALSLISIGKSTSAVQTNCLWAYAENNTSVADVAAINAIGIHKGSGRYGMGAYLEGRRTVNTASCYGAELRSANNTGTDGAYNAAGASNTMGLWITASGTDAGRLHGAAISMFGLNTNQFDVGLAFPAGAVKTAAISDDSSALTSIRIGGTHATAGISIASGSGGMMIGVTTPTVAGTLLEVSPPDANTDPLVVFGRSSGTARIGSVQMRTGSNSGSKWFITSSAAGFFTGTAVGDTGMVVNAAGKKFHIGGLSQTSVLAVEHTGTGQLGFYNHATAAQQTVTGSRGGNAALASLLTALAASGLIVDSSS